jgi:predicted ArsR family transcriptional regulator
MKDQQFLFDCEPTGTNQYGTPLSRKSDPETSKEAAAKLNTGQARKCFLEGLANCGRPSTANEIAIEFKGAMMQETIRKRAKELVNDGLVEIDGKRTCLFTNRSATTYKLTEKGRNELGS